MMNGGNGQVVFMSAKFHVLDGEWSREYAAHYLEMYCLDVFIPELPADPAGATPKCTGKPKGFEDIRRIMRRKQARAA